jgi:hypothetical protein
LLLTFSIVGRHDLLYQRVPDNIASGELNEANPGNPGEHTMRLL